MACGKPQARAAGTAAPETDEHTGKMINPHNPEFITKVRRRCRLAGALWLLVVMFPMRTREGESSSFAACITGVWTSPLCREAGFVHVYGGTNNPAVQFAIIKIWKLPVLGILMTLRKLSFVQSDNFLCVTPWVRLPIESTRNPLVRLYECSERTP